ncbi:MAG: hypothetical protein CFH06_01202 [Alphaproteobacteria bacterium MarineAlpha3_Bin5]|nr:hypothetical protein [Magnetovibrio sp.]PPR77567.1 MAG: hypothetical protein CFH06_01202 [Alphaproteobacteria bacterium MarineAlpha3_Bin5]|tara:strand:+ start:523 stop:711 length:189 start_codon:yes stop_codon:yes gene_type:complete
MRFFSFFVGIGSIITLIYVFFFPPKSMLSDKFGVPHFTPEVIHPETGSTLTVSELIRHFKGQ